MNARRTSIILLSAALVLPFGCREEPIRSSDAVEPAGTMLVEASCGQCQFGMEGSGCDLAVRIDGQAWYVDGSGIDDHGDAHGVHGLCNAIRMADVSGSVIDGRFLAERIVLRPVEP